MVLVVLNYKQVNIDKHCTLTIATDGTEEMLSHVLKPYKPCAADLRWLKGLYCVVLQEREDPSETSEGLTHTYTTKNVTKNYISAPLNVRPECSKFEISVPGDNSKIYGILPRHSIASIMFT